MADEQDLSLLSDPFAPAPGGGQRPFEVGSPGGAPAPVRRSSLISDPQEAERLQDATRRASATTPDVAARVLKLQRRTGFPVTLVERNLEAIERQTAGADFDVEKFRAESPLLAGWLAQNPAHASLTQDDLVPLSALERTLSIARNVAGAAIAGVAGFSQGIWGAVQAGAESVELTAPPSGPLNRMVGQLPPADVTPIGAPAGGVAEFARATAAIAGHLADTARGAQAGAGFIERSVYGGVESVGQMAPGIVAGVLTGPAALLTLAGVTTGGQSYSQARAQGVGVERSLAFGAFQGAVEVGTEFIPAHRLIGDLAGKAPFLTMLARQVASEIPTEEVATVFQDLAEWAVLPVNADRTFGDYLKERPSAAAATAISTIVAVGATTITAHATAKVLEQLGDAARTSKTIGRLPEKVQEFIADAAPDTVVHLPLDTFTTYFQSKDIDPAMMAARLTGNADAYTHAQRTHEDLIVPIGRYVTDVAATEHSGYFAAEARLAPGAANLREQRALDAAVAAQIAAVPAAPAASTAVSDAVLSLLDRAGFTPHEARVNAKIVGDVFQSIGTRADLDPIALFDTYRLRIEREGVTPPDVAAPIVELAPDERGPDVPASLARPGETAPQREQRRRGQYAELLALTLRDAQTVDPTVDLGRIREEFASRVSRFEDGGTLTREGGRDPQALLRAIAKAGGLGPETREGMRGEITRLKAGAKFGAIQGVANVFKAKTTYDTRGHELSGRSLDGMLEALQQDPRFTWLESINQLLEVLDSAVRDPLAPDAFPGSAELKHALGIQLGAAWWRPAARSEETADDDGRTYFQTERNSRRDQLETRIRAARAKGTDDLRAVTELQTLDELERADVGPAAERATDARDEPNDPNFFRQDELGSIRFAPDGQVLINLFKSANRSTFLHESAHLYLTILGDVVDELSARDLATLTDTQRRLLSDYGAVLQWLGVDSRAGIGTDEHEQWARGFEAYLLEGVAPSPELRSVFARVRAWLIDIYRSAGALRVELTPDIRAVMDRLLASDDAIEAAQRDQHFAPVFTDAIAAAAGLSVADRDAYRATVQAASDRARDTLQAKLLQQLQRERAAWWKTERSAVRAQVAKDFVAEPVYRALALLQKGTRPDGSPLPAGTEPFKLSKDALVEQFGDGVLKRLPRPLVYTARDGVPPSVAAELLGFPSSAALVNALVHTRPIRVAIEAAADEEMIRRHGDLLLDGSLLEHARQAVLEAGADVFAAELATLAAVVTRQPGGSRITVAPVETLRAIAARRIAGTPIKDLRPAVFAAAARRAGDDALENAGLQQFAAALKAKERQVLNAELYRAATAARDTVDEAIAGFKPIFGRDAAMAARYNLDLVTAARALLSQFELAPPAQGAAAHVYLEQVRKYDPDMHADLEVAIDAAAQPGRPYRELTLDEFTALRDAVDNLFHTARRSRQMVIDGKVQELDEVKADLQARLATIGAPMARRGYDRAVSQWEKTKLYLMGFRASLRRVESWVDAVDGGDSHGAFRRVLFTPISEAASLYRAAKRTSLDRYLALVKTVESSLTSQDIAAPEIGYTFAGKIELLHALLHTGNESNLSKLLRGREWGTDTAAGVLDTSRWDAFIRRLWNEGTLTKADYDYVQGVWTLLEDLKPAAQAVHHEMFGFFFAEITARPITTPFGSYAGGYFPAIVDPFIATDAAVRADKAALEQTPNSFMFPTTGRGFTKGRIEPYARPLALDLRVVPGHIDQVLRFVHLEPRVKDVARLVMNKGFKRAIDTFDPTVAGELLVPWLQRASQQRVDTPAQGWGGRGADRFWRALRRRTGMQIMVANVVNALQQVTGLSVAALKVPVPSLRRALWHYVRSPRVFAADVAEKSVFMRTTVMTSTIEVQQHIDDLLLNPSKYEQARAFATQHGYFLSSATQNVVNLISWGGAYDHGIAEGDTEGEAVRRADAAVRLTQGTFNPEDLSAFETGSPMKRAFTMFYSYFNMLANTLGTEVAVAVRDLGLKAGAGRLLYVYAFGFVIPAVLSEVLTQAASGRPWDDDDDGLLIDDLLALFFGAQLRTATAMLPGIGPAVNVGINAFNDKWYDDRISVSPAVNAIENAVHAPQAVYDAIVNDGRKKTAIRDTLTLMGLLTGMPVAPLGKPLGYLADVVDEHVAPSGPIDAARGLVTGR